MNYKYFYQMYQRAQYDEVKVIARDAQLAGAPAHIAAATRQKGCICLYILEESIPLSECGDCEPSRRKTNRETMIEGKLRASREESAIHITSMKAGDCEIQFSGGTAGNLMDGGDPSETYIWFMKMIEQGWRLPEESHFYNLPWNHVALAVLTNADAPQASPEALPDFEGEIELVTGKTSHDTLLQIPVQLTVGTPQEIPFTDENGEEKICYINDVRLENILQKERKRFADEAYRAKMLAHVTEEELQEMEQLVLSTLERDCPEGMCFISVEYECEDDLAVQFYAADYLGAIPEPNEGSCTSLIFMSHPEQEYGPHGLKNRICIIQYAVPVGTNVLDAELFEVVRTIPERTFLI